MKTLKTTVSLLSLAFFCFIGQQAALAQDHIITTNGKIVKGNVKHIGNDDIAYRRYFHRYKISVDKVLYIEFKNGSKKEINPITFAKNYKNYNQSAKTTPLPDSVKSTMNTSFHPLYIERIGSSFRIDTTRIVGYKTLNSILAQNPNPMVQMQLKSAKMMRTFTTISKITSFPSSAGGAFASYNTFKAMFDQLKAGPAPFKTYFNAGLSFLGTISVPITSGILKHIQKKLYDKTMMLYSMGG
jgi:hypothetical protein